MSTGPKQVPFCDPKKRVSLGTCKKPKFVTVLTVLFFINFVEFNFISLYSKRQISGVIDA